MPLLPSETKKFTCIACEDTGKNSKGGVCSPCEARGRVKEKVKVVEKERLRIEIEDERRTAPSLWEDIEG